MKRKTKKARKFIKRRLKGGNPSQITVGNIADALTDVKQETGISEKVQLDGSTLDIIMQKLEDGLENINDYYIDCFENSEYLEFINEKKLKSFISKNIDKDVDEELNTKKILDNSRFLPNDLFKDINILKIIYLFKYHYSKAVFMRLDILEMMFLIMKKMVLTTKIDTKMNRMHSFLILSTKVDTYDSQNDFDEKFNALPLWIAKNRDDEFGWTQEILVISVECIESLIYYINKASEYIGWSNESKYHERLQEKIKENLKDVQKGGGNYSIENIFFDHDYNEYYYKLLELKDKIRKLDEEIIKLEEKIKYTKTKEKSNIIQEMKKLREEREILREKIINLKKEPLKKKDQRFQNRDYTEPEEWKNPRNFANYIGEEKKEFDVMSILHKYYHINENYGLHEEEIQYVIACGYITYFFKIILLNNLMVTDKGSYFMWEMIKQIMHVYFDIEWINNTDYIYKELQILQENQINGFSQGDNKIKFLIDEFMDKLLEEKFIIDGKEEVLKNKSIQGSVQYIGPNQDNENEIQNSKESLEQYFPVNKERQREILIETTKEEMKEEIYKKINIEIGKKESETLKRKIVDEIFNSIIKLKPDVQIFKTSDRNKIVRNTISKDILNDIIDQDRSKRYTYMKLKKILITIFKIYQLRLSQEKNQSKISFIMLKDLQNIINELSIQINNAHFAKHIIEISNFQDDDKHIIIDSAFYLEFVCNFSKIIRKATYENNIVKKEKIENVVNLMVILANQIVKGLHATTFNLRNVFIGFGFFGLWIIISICSFLPFIIILSAGSLIWYGSAQLLKSNESNDESWSPYVKGATSSVAVGVTANLVVPVYSSIGAGLHTIGFTHWVNVIFGFFGTTSWLGTIPYIGGPIAFFIQWFGFDIIRIYYALFIPILFTWGIWLDNKSVIMESIQEMKANKNESVKSEKKEEGSKRRSKKRSKRR
tara:strand:- start:4955 stop:7780 length:2826 start_codon:yes stop_codon:yes gene_type:complete